MNYKIETDRHNNKYRAILIKDNKPILYTSWKSNIIDAMDLLLVEVLKMLYNIIED